MQNFQTITSKVDINTNVVQTASINDFGIFTNEFRSENLVDQEKFENKGVLTSSSKFSKKSFSIQSFDDLKNKLSFSFQTMVGKSSTQVKSSSTVLNVYKIDSVLLNTSKEENEYVKVAKKLFNKSRNDFMQSSKKWINVNLF